MLALSSPEDSSPYYLTFMVFLSLLELDSDWKSNSFVMELFWEAMFGNVKISFVFVFWWHDHFWLNYSFKRSCKKIWKAAFKNFGVFFLSSQGHRALCFSKEQQVSLKPLKRSTQSFSAVRSASVITWKQLRSRCSLSPDKDTVRISWVIVGKLSERGGCC